MKRELGQKKNVNNMNYVTFLLDEYDRFSQIILENYSDVR